MQKNSRPSVSFCTYLEGIFISIWVLLNKILIFLLLSHFCFSADMSYIFRAFVFHNVFRLLFNIRCREFPGGPVVGLGAFTTGAQVRSLFGTLRSCKPRVRPKIKIKKIALFWILLGTSISKGGAVRGLRGRAVHWCWCCSGGGESLDPQNSRTI